MYYRRAERHADTLISNLTETKSLVNLVAAGNFAPELKRAGFSDKGLARFAKRLKNRFGDSIIAAERPQWSKSHKIFRMRFITADNLFFAREGDAYDEPCILFTEAIFIWHRVRGWHYGRYDTGSLGRHCMTRLLERGLSNEVSDREADQYLLDTVKQIARDLTEASEIYTKAADRGYSGREVMLPVRGGIALGAGTRMDSGASTSARAGPERIRLDLRTFCPGSMLMEDQNEGFLVIHEAIQALREKNIDPEPGAIDHIVDPVIEFYNNTRREKVSPAAMRVSPVGAGDEVSA